MENSYPIINLIGQRRDVRVRKAAKNKQLTKTTMMVGGIYSALMVIVIIIRIAMVSQFNSLESNITATKANISGMDNREAKYRLIDHKLSELSTFIANKKPIQPKIDKVYALMPEGVIIENISFGESEDILGVTVRAENVFYVGDLLLLLEDAVKEDFSYIVIDSTSRDIGGFYKLNMEFGFENG